MTVDEIKKLLRSYLPARIAVRTAEREAKRAHDLLISLRAAAAGFLPRAPGFRDPVAEAVSKVEECEQQLVQAANNYAKISSQVNELIMLADDIEGQAIIRIRWMEGIKFDYIPAKINMSRRTMFNHYDRAIEEIAAKTESLH